MNGRALAALLLLGAASPPAPGDFARDAVALDALVRDNYAYLDRLPGGVLPDTPALAAERAQVHDRDSLLHYAEDRLATLADHHAITGSSFPDDWALVPSYADLWIARESDGFRIDQVRAGSPALAAGIVAGDRLVAVGGVPITKAVAGFWRPFGLEPVGERADYAARVLAAGRRDRPRVVTVAGVAGTRTVALLPLYAASGADPKAPLSCFRFPADSSWRPGEAGVHFFNSLGDSGTIAAFDRCMASLPRGAPVEIDLTDTPSGGNTTVARAIMAWFATRPTGYQVHRLAAEERQFGVVRQWVEQVLPRPGKHHDALPTVRVGRWTGSMGEGLAIGLEALGARVCGTAMAGLRGGVYDFTLPASGLVVKLPAERTYTVAGLPREAYVPPGRCTAP